MLLHVCGKCDAVKPRDASGVTRWIVNHDRHFVFFCAYSSRAFKLNSSQFRSVQNGRYTNVIEYVTATRHLFTPVRTENFDRNGIFFPKVFLPFAVWIIDVGRLSCWIAYKTALLFMWRLRKFYETILYQKSLR